MRSMFAFCISLEYLDISNFNTSQVTDFNEIFYFLDPLKYINLYNAQIIDEIKNEIKDIIEDSTIICQKDDFKIDEDKTYIKACCEYMKILQ